jgi:LPS export ABC transporter protein LptC
MRKSVFILIFAFLFLVVASGCREEQKIDVTSGIDPKSMATMTTKNVATFISDSGVVQYKVVAPLWKVFEETDTPYWIFPEGLYLQKYDPYFHVIATVAADSARFYSNQKLWRLDGHVEMTKAPSDLFQTSQLFWDQRRGRVYSDSFIHIETATHVLEGLGFESDERLTSYRIIKPQGIFPINSADFSADRQNGREAPDSTFSAPAAMQTVSDP